VRLSAEAATGLSTTRKFYQKDLFMNVGKTVAASADAAFVQNFEHQYYSPKLSQGCAGAEPACDCD
jgi:hypothetical protein